MMREFGFVYDSSIAAPVSDPPLWPYTLDYQVYRPLFGSVRSSRNANVRLSVCLSNESFPLAVNLHFSGSDHSQVTLRSFSGLSQIYYQLFLSALLAYLAHRYRKYYRGATSLHIFRVCARLSPLCSTFCT